MCRSRIDCGEGPTFLQAAHGRTSCTAVRKRGWGQMPDVRWGAVGTGLWARPPHGSGRAGFPHPALASGDDAEPAQRIGEFPGQARFFEGGRHCVFSIAFAGGELGLATRREIERSMT